LTDTPVDISDQGADDPAEWSAMKQHPTEGLLLLFDMHGFTDVPYCPMFMAYEHHMKIDLTGYPENTRSRKPGLFSRIVWRSPTGLTPGHRLGAASTTPGRPMRCSRR